MLQINNFVLRLVFFIGNVRNDVTKIDVEFLTNSAQKIKRYGFVFSHSRHGICRNIGSLSQFCFAQFLVNENLPKFRVEYSHTSVFPFSVKNDEIIAAKKPIIAPTSNAHMIVYSLLNFIYILIIHNIFVQINAEMISNGNTFRSFGDVFVVLLIKVQFYCAS